MEIGLKTKTALRDFKDSLNTLASRMAIAADEKDYRTLSTYGEAFKRIEFKIRSYLQALIDADIMTQHEAYMLLVKEYHLEEFE